MVLTKQLANYLLKKDKYMKLAVISVHGCPVRQKGLGSAGGMNVFLLESSKIMSD